MYNHFESVVIDSIDIMEDVFESYYDRMDMFLESDTLKHAKYSERGQTNDIQSVSNVSIRIVKPYDKLVNFMKKRYNISGNDIEFFETVDNYHVVDALYNNGFIELIDFDYEVGQPEEEIEYNDGFEL